MRAVALVACVGLCGCLQDLGSTGDMLARDAAKGVVNSVVAARYPGVDASVMTDCIIDNANAAEILQIAEGAVLGTTEATTALVVEIAARPETVRCTAGNVLGGNLLGLSL